MHNLNVTVEYIYSDIVYLKTDPQQLPRMVTAIKLCADGGILYQLTAGTVYSDHYGIELSSEKDVLITSTN